MSKEDASKQLILLHQNTSSSPELDKMRRSVAPFLQYFGLHHFYYTKIFPSGHYSALGTCDAFRDFWYTHPELLNGSPCIRHPQYLKSGIFIENNISNPEFLNTLDLTFIKFKMKFTIRIQRKSEDGFEFFGFSTKFIKNCVDDLLINELPLVYKFLDYFVSQNQKIIRLADENKVDIIPLVGASFHQKEEDQLDPSSKTNLIRHMGLEAGEDLTKREKEILKFLANGYPARYIASKLYISVRTVEHHLAEIKTKLCCQSKVELIHKAKNSLIDS